MAIEHEVVQGDCISSISYRYGFFPDTIWNDPANAELKSRRKNPNVLYEGDVVHIPDLRRKEVARPTDAQHSFVRKGVPELLHIVLLDSNGDPRRFLKYLLNIDGHLSEGQTNGDGDLKEAISPDARFGEIRLGEGSSQEVIQLNLGYLDPVAKVTGLKQRLANLGYECGTIDGETTPDLESALEDFQADTGLETTGTPDEQTEEELQGHHGS